MKLVVFRYMNPLSFFIGIVLMIAACGVNKPLVPGNTIANTNKISEMPFPIVVCRLYGTQTPDTAKIRKVLLQPIKVMMDARNPPYDTLLKYNFRWQNSYLRLVDSNIKRRIQRGALRQGKDSALLVAKETRNMVKNLQDKQGATQAVGEGVLQLSDTIAGYIIYYIAAIVTAHLLLPLFQRKKQHA